MKRAFTLIELLVVVAIIAILAAILFPVFAQAKEAAKKSVCVSNEKQIGLAILLYSNDFEDTAPLAAYPTDWPPTPSSDNITWYYLVDPYVKASFPQKSAQESTTQGTQNIWVDPEWSLTNNKRGPWYGGSQYAPAAQSFSTQSYVISEFISPYDGLTPYQPSDFSVFQQPAKSLTSLQSPSNVILVAESRGTGDWTTGNDTGVYGTTGLPWDNASDGAGIWQYVDAGSYVEGRSRHGGGSHYLLSDGHVKYFKAPNPNRQADNFTPTVSHGPVVWKQSINPGASAWFLDGF